MKKEGANLSQDIMKQYGLDKYEKNEYTLGLFKEFRKIGGKLNKIANYEDMQAKGKPITQEIQELVDKKSFFQNHLASLKFSLDAYSSFLQKTKAANVQQQASVAPAIDLEQERKVLKQEIYNECSQKIALLLKVGYVLEHQSKSVPTPVISNSLANNAIRDSVPHLIKILASIKEGTETSLNDEVLNSKNMIQKFIQGSTEELDISGKEVKFSDILHFVEDAKTSSGIRFTFPNKKTENSLPPGLFPQPKKEMKTALVGTTETLADEGELPPDPSQRLPVSVLVGNIAETQSQNVNSKAVKEEEKTKTPIEPTRKESEEPYENSEEGANEKQDKPAEVDNNYLRSMQGRRPRRMYYGEGFRPSRYKSGKRRGDYTVWSKKQGQ